MTLPRRGSSPGSAATAAEWTAANTVLGDGETGLETDTKRSKIGDGTTAWNALEYTVPSGTATLDFGEVAAQSHVDLTIAVTGAVVGDSVALGVPTAAVTTGIAYTAWVSAADTVTVRAHNYTAGALDPASGTFKATIIG